MIKLQSGEQKVMTEFIYSLCSITLDQSKGYLIESRLSNVAEDSGCASFSQLMSRARTDPSGAIKRRIVDSITTGETLFFRDSAPFELLRNKIIPDLIDSRMRSKSALPIRIWSAACSTGQEIYSIAMLLNDLLRDSSKISVRLLGTDISDQAVARASKGIYGEVEMSRGLPPHQRDRYFRQVPEGWQIRDEIRGMASFKKLNLMSNLSALGKFDIVFCRNVAIYFSDHDRLSLFNRIEKVIERDGYLVIGAMESLAGLCPQYEAKRHVRSVYYQVRPASEREVSRI